MTIWCVWLGYLYPSMFGCGWGRRNNMSDGMWKHLPKLSTRQGRTTESPITTRYVWPLVLNLGTSAVKSKSSWHLTVEIIKNSWMYSSTSRKCQSHLMDGSLHKFRVAVAVVVVSSSSWYPSHTQVKQSVRNADTVTTASPNLNFWIDRQSALNCLRLKFDK